MIRLDTDVTLDADVIWADPGVIVVARPQVRLNGHRLIGGGRFPGPITGHGTLEVNGSGPVLQGPNTYTGLTLINFGIALLGHSNALGAAGSPENGTIVGTGAANTFAGLDILGDARLQNRAEGDRAELAAIDPGE